MKIIRIQDFNKNFDDISISKFWSVSNKAFSKRHDIHTYPAKFPPLLVDKSIKFAKKKNVKVNNITDIFCGCGTTALESLLARKNFWGIDHNPVATLITKVKVSTYNINILEKYYDSIVSSFNKRTIKRKAPYRILGNGRLKYWYRERELEELNALLVRINRIVPKGKYRDFFLCVFSGILKRTSLWLQKSIKPTKDYDKNPHAVINSFVIQYKKSIKAIESTEVYSQTSSAVVKTGNIMKYGGKVPSSDLLITSPPYVTSYEYADLHQLSSLWLNYAKDFRELRKGSIGSVFKVGRDLSKYLNFIGKDIVYELKQNGNLKKSKAVAKYFYDMKIVIKKIKDLIRPRGLGVIIIGNTEYSGVKIDNVKYVAYELFIQKMTNIKVYKREIGTKILTRYRDKKGRFTSKNKSKSVYHCEFLITFQTPYL